MCKAHIWHVPSLCLKYERSMKCSNDGDLKQLEPFNIKIIDIFAEQIGSFLGAS